MKKQRGSVMLFVIVMVSMMTVSILASVQLATSSSLLQARRESSAKARFAYEGAIQIALTDYRKNTLTLPSTTDYSVGDMTVKLSTQDNSTVIPRTIKVDGEISVQGEKLTFTRTVGNRKEPHPFYYAVFVNQNLDPTKAITLGSGGSLGDICVNGSIVARTNAFTVNGDLETVGTTLPALTSVTGNTMKQVPAITMPTFNKSNYQASPGNPLLVSLLTSLGFPALEPFQLLHRSGDLSLSGSYSGKGTIFVDGNVTISGNMTYSNSDSRLVVITTGSVTLAAGVTSYVGFFYTPVEFKTSTTSATLTKGSIATQKLTLLGPMTVVHDPSLWNDPSEAVDHKVPGFWP